MPTQICITVDIEFSIGGAFAAPDRNLPIGEPNVTCAANGQEYGLGFILETLRRFDLSATFFVETLNYCYFGDKPMATIAEKIMQAGHDIQLHLHPNWLYFRHPDWKRRLSHERPNDSCAGRSDAELDEMISLGLATFQRWDIPRPVALRTGNLRVDYAVYRAMARHGLHLASNVGCAIWLPPDPRLRFLSGKHRVEGIVELPVLTYTDFVLAGSPHRHNLTITGCSFREIKSLLNSAHARGLSPVVLLTHAFEYVNRSNERYTKVRPHPTNRSRLTNFCRLVAENPEKFSATTFADGLADWTAGGQCDDVELRVPVSAALGRMITAQIDDRFRTR